MTDDNTELGVPTARQIIGWLLRRHDRYRVVGASMEPTLLNDDLVLVSKPKAISPDQIVVARHPTKEATIIMKRVERVLDGEVWLVSDNPAGSDSLQFGSVQQSAIIGVVTARFPRP